MQRQHNGEKVFFSINGLEQLDIHIQKDESRQTLYLSQRSIESGSETEGPG